MCSELGGRYYRKPSFRLTDGIGLTSNLKIEQEKESSSVYPVNNFVCQLSSP